ncbi:SLATT domain-containing protein [Flavobacterium sp. KACC 22761]|uniref:SLATT domain-containing protein n=1 Tax=Flavobacterium sp. KACC 22761 TaxID=3092665 RepID=UPI002A759163|nr:SLATT domain-containing protein [Flavobacterium sp. KACC 22761]WPO78202.1 SLATT domain-containing protein [Flavobacterium sp. KACC 22761]
MNQNDFLNTLAQKGYDIGFGAKKNFSSYDIINKLPSWVGFISLAIGIVQIAYENIAFNKELSILLIFVGIAIVYIDVFKDKADDYNNEGIRLTRIFNATRDLYYLAKGDNNFVYQNYDVRYQALLNDFYSNTLSKQVFMSQWFAHYKFFYEMQVGWIEEELKLKFFKDKVPNSLKTLILIIFIIILICISYEYRANIQGLFE